MSRAAVTATRPGTRQKRGPRGRILHAARTLFARRGYDAVTMREIGRQVGYTATALYYHFPDKSSLLHELCETDFRALSDRFQQLRRVADPVERLRRTGITYVNFGLAFPQHYRLMFMTPRPPRPARCPQSGNPDQDAYGFLLQAVREAIQAGRFRPELRDANRIAQALWATVHGLVALHLTKSDDRWLRWRSPRSTARLMTDALLGGFLRGEGPAPGLPATAGSLRPRLA